MSTFTNRALNNIDWDLSQDISIDDNITNCVTITATAFVDGRVLYLPKVHAADSDNSFMNGMSIIIRDPNGIIQGGVKTIGIASQSAESSSIVINGILGEIVQVGTVSGIINIEYTGFDYYTAIDPAILPTGGPQGAQGARGNVGAQGAQGAQGAEGQQGSQGAQGAEGQQGAQGAEGQQGDTGAQGQQGAQGAEGQQGDTGAQGQQGAQGAEGQQGDTGAQGAQGQQGAEGQQGDTGAQGAQGHQGATGAQGNQGHQGATGAQGNQGHQGATGAQGNQGHQGATGAQGNQGAQGATGAQGNQGHQGATGAQGNQGHQGATGAQGNQGHQGATGAQGNQGHQGATGAQGQQGAQGSTGPSKIYTQIIWVDPSGNDTAAAAAPQGDMIVPFATLGGALSYLRSGLKLGWTIEVQAGTYIEEDTMEIDERNSGVCIHLSGGVSIQFNPEINSKILFYIQENCTCTFVGDEIDASYTNRTSGRLPTVGGGASIITNSSQVMFVMNDKDGNSTQQVSVSNIALISPSATIFTISGREDLGFKQHTLNVTNCYIKQEGTDINSHIISGNNQPQTSIINIRDCYHFNNSTSGISYNFASWRADSIELKLRLKNNIFYATTTSQFSEDTGHIITNAPKDELGRGLFDWYWQGNTFYCSCTVINRARYYAWYDAGISTQTCRLTNTTHSISNWYTFNSPPISNITEVVMYGTQKILAPSDWNRS